MKTILIYFLPEKRAYVLGLEALLFHRQGFSYSPGNDTVWIPIMNIIHPTVYAFTDGERHFKTLCSYSGLDT
jgi:hypothetical protein